MSEREPYRNAGKLLLLACCISFICFLGSYMRIPIVPLFAVSLGADSVQVGLINSAFMLVAGLFCIPSGLISDRVGRKVPLLVGLMLLSGSSFLLYWCKSPLQMGGVYLLFGVGLSAFTPTLMSYVADITPPEVLGQAYGWYTMAVYSGMTVGPAVGGFLGTALGLRQVFLVAGGLIAAIFFLALFFLPASRRRAVQHRAILPTLRQLLKNRPLLACLAATMGTCVGFGMFVTFMPLYIRSLGLGTASVGFVFAAQSLSNALSRLPSGKLADRVRDRGVLVKGGVAVFALALAGFSLCDTLVPLMAAACLMGISMGIAFTAIGAVIAEVVSREMRGLAMGCYNTCVYLGMMLSAVGMGKVIKSAGFHPAFLLNGVVEVTVLLLFMIVYRRSEKGMTASEGA